MIIDFHTHIFPDKIAKRVIDKLSLMSKTKAFSDGTMNGLLKSMRESSIDLSVILPVATNAHQVEGINSKLVATSNLISFGAMHPDCADYVQELKRLKLNGVKGIKIHPVYQGTDIDDVKYLRIFEKVAELDMIVVTHAGDDIGFPNEVHCTPKMIRHVINEVGEFKMIAAHMGGWKNWNEVVDNLADTKIFIDTAFSTDKIIPRDDFKWQAKDLKLLNVEEFIGICEAFGFDKVIFGTDSPWSEQKKSVDFIKNLPITEINKDKILSLNAKRLLNI